MGGYREQQPHVWAAANVSERTWWRFLWALLLPILVAVWYGAFRGGRVNGPLLYLGAFGSVGVLVASIFGILSRKHTYGTFEMDDASVRVEGRAIFERRDVRWVFRPPREARGWMVHRRFYQPPLRLDFEDAADDVRFGQELGEHLGTPPAWGASPLRAHMWIAILSLMLAVGLPFVGVALLGKSVGYAFAAMTPLVGVIACPTRLSLRDGELREAWLWGVRRVAIADIERYDLVMMDHQKRPSYALRVHLRGGRTRRFGIGIRPEDHRIVDALRRELEQRRTRIVVTPTARVPIAAQEKEADIEEPDVESWRALRASPREP